MAVHYRNVEKSELMRSIAEGVEWLKTLDLGPVSAEILAEIGPAGLLDRLCGAGTDAALAKVMRESGIGPAFYRFHDVFSYEPEVFPHEKALSGAPPLLFRRLTAWGAFSPANDIGSNPHELDEEERRYRIRTAIAHLAQKGMPDGSQEARRFEEILAERKAADEAIAARLDMLVPILLLLREAGEEGEIRFVLAQNVPDLPALLDTLHGVMKVEAPAGVSTANQPVMAYAIPMEGEISDYSGVAYDDILTMLAPLKQRLHAVLEPFKDTDEVTRVSTGTIGRLNKFGIFFYATQRAAQAVADALSDVEVIDFNGRQVKPRPSPGPAGGSPVLGM